MPWQEVNNGACGAWHIGAITAYPEHRGRRLGSEFLRIAEQVRPASGAYAISLLVADTNMGARRLYERFGFREAARRPMAKGHWTNPGVASGLVMGWPRTVSSSHSPHRAAFRFAPAFIGALRPVRIS